MLINNMHKVCSTTMLESPIHFLTIGELYALLQFYVSFKKGKKRKLVTMDLSFLIRLFFPFDCRHGNYFRFPFSPRKGVSFIFKCVDVSTLCRCVEQLTRCLDDDYLHDERINKSPTFFHHFHVVFSRIRTLTWIDDDWWKNRMPRLLEIGGK